MASFSLQMARDVVWAWRLRRCSARGFRQLTDWMGRQADLPGPVLYDVGARWGPSPPYDRLSAVPGFVGVGFEADPEEADRLRAAKLFHHVCTAALGARPEERTLYVAKDPGSSSIFQPNPAEIARHTTWKGFETAREVKVMVEPLDDVIARHRLPPPDYLKIDCEGAEGEILDGAPHAIQAMCGVTFEARLRDFYHGGATLSQLLEKMLSCGFICLRLDPVGSFFGAHMMFDVVMMRHPDTIRDHRQFVLCLLFCLLHNSAYARRLIELRAADFGWTGLSGFR